MTRLGVDLGTTWTAAALQRNGRSEAVALGSDTAAMPSVVAVDNGHVVTGERAERQLLLDPASGLRECKRRLGDTTPMVMAGKPYGAEALMGHLLCHVVEAAAGSADGEIVLTHPATWGDYKLDLLREAGRQAGVRDVSLLPEPVAAALHYVSLGRIGPGDVVAVYDFGGGTFDAAVVRCTERGAEILGQPEGLERVGGIDLDQIVVLHVDQALDGRLREIDSTDPDGRRALARLRAECTAAKEALSTDTEATIQVTVPGLHTQVRITRDEFEAAARTRVADTLGALDRAVASADVVPSALAGVLLVGGSSRIPVVGEEVGRHLGRPTLLDADPKLVVALGAAGGSTVTTTEKPEANANDTSAKSTTNTPPPPPPAPSAAARAGANAAALRAAAGAKPPGKDAKDGGFVGGAAAVAGLGVAAAGAAGAADVGVEMLGDDKDKDKDEPEVPEDEQALTAEPPPDNSMDAFDDVSKSVGGGPGGRASAARGRGRAGADDDGGDDGPVFGGGGGAPRGMAGAPSQPAAPGSPTSAPAPDPVAAAPDISDARAELLERFAAWTPPEGADAAEVAAFRSEIEELVNAYQPRPGQGPNDALAELRRQFDDQVEDFVQDLKIDAIVKDRAPDGPDPAPDPRPPTPPPTPTPSPQPGYEWVEPHVGPDGRLIPGHWERARARADTPPADDPEPDDGDRHWVAGQYDDQGRYLPGHWEYPPDDGEARATVMRFVEGYYDRHGDWVEPHWESENGKWSTGDPPDGYDGPPLWGTPSPSPEPPAPTEWDDGEPDWVDGHYDDQGNYVRGHWEIRPDDDHPPPPEDGEVRATVMKWVDGHTDEHGNYVEPHWENEWGQPFPDMPPPPDYHDQWPTTPPLPTEPPPYDPRVTTPPFPQQPPQPEPQPQPPPPPPPPPIVRDHRGDGPDGGGVSVTPSGGDRGRPVVRDHRGDNDTNGDVEGSGPLDGLRDAFDDVFRGSITPAGAPAPEPEWQDSEPAQVARIAAPPAEPPAGDEDLLGTGAFAHASAAAPQLGLTAEMAPVAEPAPVAPAPEAAPEPAPEPVAAVPEADQVLTIVDPIPGSDPLATPGLADQADHREPDPTDDEAETPSDLDTNPHTPL